MANWNPDIPLPRLPSVWRLHLPFPRLWWFVAGVAVLGAVGVAATLLTQIYTLGIVAAGIFFVVLVVWGNAAHRRRQRDSRTLLSYVQQALSLKMAIPSLLATAEAGESKAMQKRLRTLRDALERGEPLSKALQTAAPGTPARSIGMIAVAERHGTVPDAMERLLNQRMSDDERGVWRDFGLFRSYLLLLVLVFSGVLLLSSVFVLPKYVQIFTDFHLQPTALMMVAIDENSAAVTQIVSILALIAVIYLAGRSLRRLFSQVNPGKGDRQSPPGFIIDRLLWYTPVLGKIIRDRDHADAFSAIAASLNRGASINAGIDDAMLLHLNRLFTSQLRRCSRFLQRGETLANAMRSAGFPSLVVGFCSTAIIANDLPATMYFLSRHYRWQFSRSVEVLHAIAAPVAACVGGAMVLGAWLWLYVPMLELLRIVSVPKGSW